MVLGTPAGVLGFLVSIYSKASSFSTEIRDPDIDLESSRSDLCFPTLNAVTLILRCYASIENGCSKFYDI